LLLVLLVLVLVLVLLLLLLHRGKYTRVYSLRPSGWIYPASAAGVEGRSGSSVIGSSVG
jgi:hypothetical protein